MKVRNSPMQFTTFVGRETELESLRGMLSDPRCRLLTLSGLGGIGKTRLALQLAEQTQQQFTDGAHFVPLQPLQSSDQIVPVIMSALAIRADQKLHDQLLAWLRDKSLLLVLDNFEQLMEGIDILMEVLEAAPYVKLLVTSRDALRLRGEWLYHLHGLDFPAAHTALHRTDYSAPQLFIECARQQGSQLNLQAQYPQIVRICQLVEGMPLALELAAGWVRVLSLGEIIAELEQNLALLKSRTHDMPDRHSSMEAVFDYSWQVLTDDERAVLRGCSVFVGGCTRSAAEHITNATLSVFTSLVEKSLLRHDPERERYDLHELVRLYAWEKLDLVPDIREALLDRHCAHYTEFLHQQGLTSPGSDPAKILPELDNLRTAWKRAVQQRNLAALQRAAPNLYWLYHAEAWFEEGAALFYLAETALREMPVTDDVRFLLGSLQLFRGYYRQRQQAQSKLPPVDVGAALSLWEGLEERPEMGLPLSRAMLLLFYEQSDIGQIVTTARKCLSFHQRYNDLHGQAISLTTLAAIASEFVGDFADAQQFLEQALTIDRQIGFALNAGWSESLLSRIMSLQGRYHEAKSHAFAWVTHRQTAGIRSALELALHGLAYAELEIEDDEAARTHFEESIALAADLRQHVSLAQGRAALGILAAFRNDLSAAAACYEDSLDALRASALRSSGDPDEPENIGFLALLLGYYDDALAHYEAEVLRFRSTGHRVRLMCVQCRLGQVLFAQGNPPQAMPHLFDAFREAVATGAFQIVLEALLGIAQVSILPPGLANQLLTLVSEHSASNRYSRTLAKRLLSAKEFSITPPAPNVTLERRQALTLEAAVALVEQFYSEAEAAHGRSHQPLTDPLSQRELEILALIADGHTNQEIADRLVVGVSTVKKHINHIYDKLNATHRVQAVALARNLKILA